jgi:hypothetical protein
MTPITEIGSATSMYLLTISLLSRLPPPALRPKTVALMVPSLLSLVRCSTSLRSAAA